MEFGSCEDTQDKSSSSSKHAVPEEVRHDVVMSENQSEPRNAFPEINMEVSVTLDDDVLCAGGIGATDDISSIIPVARDFTVFEEHLLESRGYEDSKDNIAEGQSMSSKDIDDVKKHNDDAYEAVSMEASITPDEMIRAGGFGATDDISNFLPVASDFTDFEANLRDARDYEDLNEEIKRPGLGWTNEKK